MRICLPKLLFQKGSENGSCKPNKINGRIYTIRLFHKVRVAVQGNSDKERTRQSDRRMQCDMGTRLAYPYRDANAFDRAPLNPWALMANKSTVSHLKAPRVLVLYLERPRATVGVCNLSGQAILILRLEGSRPQGSLLAFLAHRVQAIALPWAWAGEGKLERNSSTQSGDGACRPLGFTKRRPGLRRK